VLTFSDPDGMKIELVATADTSPVNAPRFASIPPEYAIRGFSGVTLLVQRLEPTAAILNVMGFQKVAEQHGRTRFAPKGTALGNHVDLLIDAEERYGNLGAGTVHHIAFRAQDDAAQLEWRAEIAKHLKVTQVLDRTYFHSIYFREPGGVLFELATDPPGFSFDEPLESLGEELRIPPWLEQHRGLLRSSFRQSSFTSRSHRWSFCLRRENRFDLRPTPQSTALSLGAALSEANAAMILLHGRGGSPQDMFSLGEALGGPGFAYLAPEAANDTWYPNPFLHRCSKTNPTYLRHSKESSLSCNSQQLQGSPQTGLWSPVSLRARAWRRNSLRDILANMRGLSHLRAD